MTARRRRPASAVRPRIKDVALAAGVSAQTVSNVLNDKPGFTEETRDRVLQAVAEIGYIRDAAARALRTGQSRRIAFSMNLDNLDPRNPFALTFLQAAITTAGELDRRVMVLMHGAEADGTFAADLADREADGFLLANSSPGDYRVRLLEEAGVPYALMGRTAPGQSQAWIDIDNAEAIAAAVDRVVEHGFRRMAYVGYSAGGAWLQDRLDGTRERLMHHGIELREDFVNEAPLHELERWVRDLLQREDRPDAIITASDSIGIMVVNVAHSLGLDVGGQLAVTGFDGGVLATTVIPPLTTVEIPVAEIASRLMHRLVDEIERGRTEAPGEIIATALQEGRTA